MMVDCATILALRGVRRWHTRPVRREQSLAEHSGLVALLCRWLAPAGMETAEREQLTHLALVHDLHETQYGDFPYPVKASMAEAGFDIDTHCQEAFWGYDIWLSVPARVKALVDVADVLEAALYARDYLPELADVVRQQALDKAAAAFPKPGHDREWVLGRVQAALEVVE
jgi:5'-deoxynucleotidase YfbR-like HD superfamily hydrolase